MADLNPALAPLESGQYDCPAPAILEGEVHQNAHLIAATKQLHSRLLIAIWNPQLINDEEIIAAMRRERQIARALQDVVDPAPDGVQMILARIDAMQRDLNGLEERLEERLEAGIATLARQLKQESQLSQNRAIRTNRDRIVPVVRLEDGESPANFPRTMVALMSADEERINEWLRFYNRRVTGTLAARIERLRKHVGCNL